MRRLALFLGFALLLLAPTSVAAVECQFVLGFKTLRDLIGYEIVGECLENQHHSANGDALQQTTRGLLVWRKADNWTAFTDGYRTWLNGPNGLVQRLNTERFAWEADYAPGGGVATPTPTPAPVATATPAPVDTPSPTATPVVTATPTLVELAMASPWYRDGVNGGTAPGSEAQALRALAVIDRNSPRLAEEMSGWVWIFNEDMLSLESRVIEKVAAIVRRTPGLVPHIARYAWLRDSVDRWEFNSLEHLHSVASNYDLDFAKELAAAPWVVDGVTLIESHFGLRPLFVLSGSLEHTSPEVARRVLNLLPYPAEEIDFFLVNALKDIGAHNPDGFERLLRARWFRDGVNEDERAYLIAAGASRLNADQLFDPYRVESATLDLPHSGTVKLWVAHRLSAHAGRRILTNMAKAVQDSEEFWELPFPVDDVILTLLVGPTRYGGVHLGHLMLLEPDYNGPRVLHHEVAHYYFNFGPDWLFEGGADYVRDFFLTSRGRVPRVQFPSYCRSNGLDNLQELVDLGEGRVFNRCRYSMGLHFMVSLRTVMGEEPWRSALRALYLEYGYESLFYISAPIDDETVYRVFMEHAPPSLKTRVRDVFRRLHGGPFVD